MRILFLGENWYGSCARACSYALRRLGHDVWDIDAQTFFPRLRLRGSRLAIRLFSTHLLHEYNAAVLDIARVFVPDILIAFKGQFLRQTTQLRLRHQGVALYNYYPDTSAFAHGTLLPHTLPEYDCVFHTKAFGPHDILKRVPLRAYAHIPHGYDPEVHRPYQLSPDERQRFGVDVAFIGTHSTHKEGILRSLREALPQVNLGIWGNGWTERCRAKMLRPSIAGTALEGSSYAKAVAAAKISLSIMSGRVVGSSRSDMTTTRTYEIPACGGFMLHERNEEVLALFNEGEEIACFGSIDELREKIVYYLGRPAEREKIAAAGHARCVPAYSYDSRMTELLRWHERHCAK